MSEALAAGGITVYKFASQEKNAAELTRDLLADIAAELAPEPAVDDEPSATIKVSLRDAKWRAVRSSGRSSRTRSAGATQGGSAATAGAFTPAAR